MIPRNTNTQTPTTFIPIFFSLTFLSKAQLSSTGCRCSAWYHNAKHPSVFSLEDGAALIEHLSVYRSTLPIGFWINRIIFLIKQESVGVAGRGRAGLWACEWEVVDGALEGPCEGCWRMQWQNHNLEKEGEIGGVNRRKANARWDRGWGAYWSPVCFPFRGSAANRGLGVYHLVNARMRTLCLGIWKWMSNAAILHVCMMQVF